ncbi:Sperm flagellar protein 2 (Protein KPL2) [Durusdinium trenchii]|uniref:Sperm flagellar protein 2 (Protein KPL2) n=1 Tax=Durusdinium trenchii TaxID=1381693 RepID=A0ABP0RK45_9DINO
MPPPNKKAVIYERLVPADSLEKSTGTLTERIHCFDVAQPEVEEILEHFGPFPDVPRLVEVNAMSSSDETFEAVEEKVALLLQRKRAEIAQAEEAARAAQATEEEAAAPVEPETADADHADAAAAAADAAPADAAADADAAENTDPPPEPPFQAVQLSELPSYVGKIEDEVFNLLMEEWSELQGDLVSSLQQLFNWHRSHLADFKSGLFGMKQRFSEFVQRSDGKQDMVDDFVERFNLFTEEYPEMRKQEPTKAELHLRAEELHQRLKAEVEKQSSENLEQLEVMQTSRWLESQTEVLASQVQHAVQLEVKRYHACCQLLSDFYYSALCLGLPEEHEAPPKVDIFAPPEPEEVPDPKKKKDDKKKKPGDAPEEPEISPEEKAAARLCKYIPDEESGGEGRWEFPFLAELMEQASKAVWKLEDFTPPSIEVPEEEEKEDPKAKAKAKGKAKAKEKPKKEEEAEKPPPQPAPALFVDLQQALLAERVTFRQRLQMIQGWAIRRLHQAASSTKSTFRDLNDWILLRRHKDLEAVASLVDVLKEQVESEDFIKTKLCLKNAHLHQRPNTLLRAPKPEKVPPEVEGVAPFRWTMEQLDLLFEVVASAAAAISPSCRVLPNYTLLRILEQLTSADGGDKRTVKVPANWRNCGEAKLKQMLAAFDHPYSGSCIDLVDFLFHMLLLHSPVGWPSLNTLMEVRRVLEAQAPRGAIWPDFYVPGHVVESLPLFEESGEESFAKKFKPITTLAPNMFDRPGAQLKWVAKVLQRYRAPSGEHEAEIPAAENRGQQE